MATPQLPVELFGAIMEWLFLDTDSKHHLWACSLASRTLRGAAQRYLLQTIFVDLSDSKRDLHAFQDLPDVSSFLIHVRELCIRQLGANGHLDPALLAHILPQLPGLRKLVIHDSRVSSIGHYPLVPTVTQGGKVHCNLAEVEFGFTRDSNLLGVLELLALFEKIDKLAVGALPELPDDDLPMIRAVERQSYAPPAPYDAYQLKMEVKQLEISQAICYANQAAPIFLLQAILLTPTVGRLTTIAIHLERYQQVAELGQVLRMCSSSIECCKLDVRYLQYYVGIPAEPCIHASEWRKLNLHDCKSLNLLVLRGYLDPYPSGPHHRANFAACKMFLDILDSADLSTLGHAQLDLLLYGGHSADLLAATMFEEAIYSLDCDRLCQLLSRWDALQFLYFVLRYRPGDLRGEELVDVVADHLAGACEEWFDEGKIEVEGRHLEEWMDSEPEPQ
ncbi:hypothetical protein EIP91_001764 [Steccherinum ochraceum]|uniref:Uncharacterized protein n=1 Tax=Steccherinum ochraceum TaxID=92696 RepID=A0A4R0RFR4_9APHY|nr:hypothetical protein EIP91_001764 [Steccherinum ochraceum]